MPDPAVTCLLLLLNVAPLGFYFLVLGLVNSHARPHCISSRVDFLALTCVMMPLLFWPVPALLSARLWWPLAIGGAVAAALFVRLLPRHGEGWVIYNISEGRWRRALESAAASAGLCGDWNGRAWQTKDGRVSLQYNYLSVLSNVSVNVRRSSEGNSDDMSRLADQLDRQFERAEQMPSTSGACLLVLGVALMVVPLWILGQHASDVAASVARLWG